MQISSRFTIAIHILTCIDTFKDDYKVTSDFLAGSINVNPVVIRRLLQQLKAAGIVNVIRGSGGAEIAKPLSEITMLDIYKAVDSIENGSLFHFHENPNKECPVGRNIHNVLDDKLNQIQTAMENEMRSITIQEIVEETKKYIQEE
ncbi:MAG: Rrf2 family transcriptional regulator [Hespellia sp.]|uniref:Transcriptional regulator, BadM/Rrf2 family n=1 Tax=Hespellia stercorisuis DSM 15480 TaxID=1121950 RepID=A0A1M6W7C7_9FIRM|nr:Rrf2 family transcriptional regulator [Hespellia stercorisuis]MDD2979934.1 Rrf2 family transcriptional regulator [Hespellia sp.]SHK89643.1 transcriptional regulator, BadM/Rrf2 family [Hespellia stercorisuis DSM 15480]